MAEVGDVDPGRRPARRDRAGAEVAGRRDRRLRRGVPGDVRARRGRRGRRRRAPETVQRRRRARCATSRQGEGGDAGAAPARLRRRPQQLALRRRRRWPRGRTRLRARPARARRLVEGRRAPATSTSLVDAVQRVPRQPRTSSACTSSGTRSAGSWRRARRCASPAARARSTLVAQRGPRRGDQRRLPRRVHLGREHGVSSSPCWSCSSPTRAWSRASSSTTSSGTSASTASTAALRAIAGQRLRRRAPAACSSATALGRPRRAAARACGASEDRIIPAEHAAPRPARPREVHVLAGSGHSPHMEAAGDVNRVMETLPGQRVRTPFEGGAAASAVVLSALAAETEAYPGQFAELRRIVPGNRTQSDAVRRAGHSPLGELFGPPIPRERHTAQRRLAPADDPGGKPGADQVAAVSRRLRYEQRTVSGRRRAPPRFRRSRA